MLGSSLETSFIKINVLSIILKGDSDLLIANKSKTLKVTFKFVNKF